MMRPLRLVALTALCGTVAVAGWGAAGLGAVESSGIETTATPIGDRTAIPRATFVSLYADRIDAALPKAALAISHLRLPKPVFALTPAVAADAVTAEPAPFELAVAITSVGDAPSPAALVADDSAVEVPGIEAPSPDSRPTEPATRVRLVSLFRSDPGDEYLKPAVRPVAMPDECPVLDVCIDEYLWALYERTPKVDTNKVTQRIKVTVKRKGKTRTVTKAVTKYVLGDFTWKDPIAAKRVGMSLKDYVIGGMDRSFKLKLFRALRAADEAGLMPGITSAFRDDYRQAIAVGNKAASDSSFHGGSRRGGYGHGLAVDVVSVRGENRMQRWASTAELWKWIDANEKAFGIGRPYLHRDPPHVGPIDGREFLAKRGGRAPVQRAALQKKIKQKATAQTKTNKTAQTKTAPKAKLDTKKRQLAARNVPVATRPPKPAKSSKVSSLQATATVQR